MSQIALFPILALTLLSGTAPLRAEDPKPADAAKTETKAETTTTTVDGDTRTVTTRYHHHWNWRMEHRSDFAWQAQLNLPVQELRDNLNDRTGLGLGVQWNHEGRKGHSRRTRIEWNIFREGDAVGLGEVRTKASNYVLSFDRLYHFSGKTQGCYVLGGLGAVRWFLEQTPGQASHTTKLAVTAGAGYRFTPYFSMEGRYLVSTLNKSFDGSMVQAGVNFRF